MNRERLSIEYFLQNKKVDVYPITLMKFLLNKSKILYYFSLVEKKEGFKGSVYEVDNSQCPYCSNTLPDHKLCRQHFSINRIFSSQSFPILKDIDTGLMFYKNEIFKIIDNKLTIIYCPHTKLIIGDLTQDKVKRIYPITVIDDKITTLNFQNIIRFDSSVFSDKSASCWFDNQFTIVANKTIVSSDYFNWFLILNN